MDNRVGSGYSCSFCGRFLSRGRRRSRRRGRRGRRGRGTDVNAVKVKFLVELGLCEPGWFVELGGAKEVEDDGEDLAVPVNKDVTRIIAFTRDPAVLVIVDDLCEEIDTF